MDKKIPFNPELHKARELTRKEVRELKAAGLSLIGKSADELNLIMDDYTDYVLDHFYADIDFDNAKNKDCIKLAGDTLKLTYGAEEEVKNS